MLSYSTKERQEKLPQEKKVEKKQFHVGVFLRQEVKRKRKGTQQKRGIVDILMPKRDNKNEQLDQASICWMTAGVSSSRRWIVVKRRALTSPSVDSAVYPLSTLMHLFISIGDFLQNAPASAT